MSESHNTKKAVTILDSTLRDGGYCNNWQFNKQTARTLVNSLNSSGVDIIEVGYKSPKTHTEKTFEGLFRFCTESQLDFIKRNDRAQYAFMIDAKEYLDHDNAADTDRIIETIPLRDNSLFSWARIATYSQNFSGCIEIIQILKEMGYQVTLNVMGISLLSPEDLRSTIQKFSAGNMDVLYFSDSFGDLAPKDVCDCISLIKEYFSGKIGIHTHDNNGLAFANTLCAIDRGVNFVDCTVMGMGRGAGNLRTEQILLHLYFKKNYKHLNPSELLEVIRDHFTPLQQELRWGWDYTYMLSALQMIHPTYCMNLRATNQYTIEQVSAILNSIASSKRKKYDEGALLEAIDTVLNEPLMERDMSYKLAKYIPKPADSILVLATGPSRDQFSEELAEFILQHKPLVIECNPKDDRFSKISQNYITCILNWVRLKKFLDQNTDAFMPLVTGIPAIPGEYSHFSNLTMLPCHVSKNELSFRSDRLTLPGYVVGMYSIGIAALSSPKIIYLAGFDGYKNGFIPEQQEMNAFWQTLPNELNLVSITPTTYSLTVEPVYKFIR